MPTQPLPQFLRRPLLLAAVLLGFGLPVWGQPVPAHKLDPLLQVRSRELSGRSRVIVEFREAADARVIARHRGRAGRQLGDSRAQVAEIDNAALSSFAEDPQVQWVGPDHDAFATLERTGAAIASTIARQQFTLTGQGVGIAVIDSGITAWHDDLYLASPNSPRLESRVVHFRDFTREVNPRVWTSEQPFDEFGHGTHVAGIIAGNGFDSDGRRMGIAPGASLIGLKVLDAEGHGYISDVIAAIDYAIAIKDRYNIRIINLSVASGVFESYKTDPLSRAAKRAVDAGIVVVASAGNLGTDDDGEVQWGGITCPGNAPWVLTVGAESHQGTARRSDDALAAFSSRGPTAIDAGAKPDLVAYGVGIESLIDPHSTLYSRFPEYLLAGTRETPYLPYLSMSGTSMAAPVVSGTIALMLEENPDLTPNAVKAILQYTAEARDGEAFLAQGAGVVNALGAVRMARFFESPRGALPEAADTIETERIAWSRQIIWGNQPVGGGIPLPGSNAWATTTTWGAASTGGGTPVIWGVKAANIVWSTGADNIVWSTGANRNRVWGSNIVWSTGSDNIVWSTGGDNIVWSTGGDNIVWSTGSDNIVWSTGADNIVWSTAADNIVWSTGTVDQILWPPPPVDNRRRHTAGTH
jgi:serine protease AprX